MSYTPDDQYQELNDGSEDRSRAPATSQYLQSQLTEVGYELEKMRSQSTLLTTIVTILTLLLLGLGGWFIYQQTSQPERVFDESGRLESDIAKRIADIEQQMNSLNQQKLNDLANDFEVNKKEVNRLSERYDRLEANVKVMGDLVDSLETKSQRSTSAPVAPSPASAQTSEPVPRPNESSETPSEP